MATLSGVPNQPKTPNRVFRCPDALWEAARAEAERRDEKISDVLRRALAEYIGRGAPDGPREAQP